MNHYTVTSRFVLHAGYSCNVRCEFCYYLEELQKGTVRDWTTQENKKRIARAAAWGKRAIDISGGEPTIRKDLPELIRYCRDKKFHTVNIITNGIKTSNMEYCRTLQQAGLSEGLFSVHSHNPQLHDALTNVKGSHNKIMQSLENFRALGLQRRVNTVVNNENYAYIHNFLELVHEFDPKTVNLIVFNPSETAAHLAKESKIRFSDYRIIGDALSDALDTWQDRFKTINVRFLPFCFLKKHTHSIRTQWQKLHEDQEWDPFLNVAYQKGYPAAVLATLAGIFCPWDTPKFQPTDFQTRVGKWLSNFRMKLYYKKNKQCRQCSVRAICTGVQQDYVKKSGFPEFSPFQLEAPVYDPLHFVKKHADIFESLRSQKK